MLKANTHKQKHPYLVAAEQLRNNDGQWEVYESAGNCVVLAGPGSGKTTTITIKIARLLAEDVHPPRGVACITYSNECARELERRLERLGVVRDRRIFVGTVHSFSLKNIILPYAEIAGVDLPDPLTIIDPREQQVIFQEVLSSEIGGVDPNSWQVRVNRYRRTHFDEGFRRGEEVDEELVRVVKSYESRLRRGGFVDFDDLILMGLKLIEDHDWVRTFLKARFPVLVVDEYQDLGLPLHRMVLSLFQSGVRLIAVGDPDQSIYGFVGAIPDLLRSLSRYDNIKLVELKLNYRCARNIVDASKIALGENREHATPPEAHEGLITFHYCEDGLEHQANTVCCDIVPDIRRRKGINIGDIAVLYPNKYVGDIIAWQVESCDYRYIRTDQNAPYRKTPLNRWLEDCAAWCSVGWRTGKPTLSKILYTLQKLYEDMSHEEFHRGPRRRFVKFLWSRREPETSLYEWLSELEGLFLAEVFEKQGTTRDRDQEHGFYELLDASKEGGKLETFSISTFGGQGGAPDHLNLLTLHSSKGLEFEAVIIVGMDEGLFPHYKASEGELNEQRRLFYVGLTRARQEVHLTYSGWTATRYGRKFFNGPSVFIRELENNLGAKQKGLK